jgi:hypothetical protein
LRKTLFIVVNIFRFFRFFINDTLFNYFKSRLLPHRSAFDIYVSLNRVN